MAETQTSLKQSSLTRGKAILVAVLAVVLVVILYVQFGLAGGKANSRPVGYRPPRSTPTRKSAQANTKTAAATNAQTGSAEVVAAPIIDATHWKSPSLATVVAYDPFALPPAFPQPKVTADGKAAGAEALIAAAAADDAKRQAESLEKLRMQLEELKQRGVHVIIREHDQYAAMIGDRMLHVGDEINGFTVTAISPDGVGVERKESP
jgi:hypothetical protein